MKSHRKAKISASHYDGVERQTGEEGGMHFLGQKCRRRPPDSTLNLNNQTPIFLAPN